VAAVGGPRVVTHFDIDWSRKVDSGERFAELAQRLTGENGILPNARIVVFGGPGEEALAAPALGNLPAEHTLDFVGKLDLQTIGAALKRCDFYIGNDSGLMHLAAAAGTLTLGLFGPSREEIYGPWGEKNGAVRTDRSFEEIVGEKGYDHRSHDSRMLDLSVDKAQRAAESVWKHAQED
jgi:ADP-heptose:LPS heptosyltransferase